MMRTIVSEITALPVGASIFSELATTVALEDEGGGLFLVVKQDASVDRGQIRIDGAEWPTIRGAIERLLKVIDDEEGGNEKQNSATE